MKSLYKCSATLICLSAIISLFLFAYPVEETFMPHWIIPLISFICLIIIISSESGPKPKHPERGFWAILLGTPILGILVQLHYLAPEMGSISIFEHELVPIIGLHVFIAIVGNYVTTSKSIMSGIPTPWNMRSDLSWRKSHRFLGYGTVCVAIISGMAAIFTGRFQENVLGIALFFIFIIFTVYSWWAWKNDPNRRALLGSSS